MRNLEYVILVGGSFDVALWWSVSDLTILVFLTVIVHDCFSILLTLGVYNDHTYVLVYR